VSGISDEVFFWEMGDGGYSSSANFTYMFDSQTENDYTVSLIVGNEYGCVDTTQKIIKVDLYVPNTFTPNGDGVNDYFMDNCMVCNKIQIFNRLGVLLYEGKEAWDGTYRGETVGNDTYFYIITTAHANPRTYKGYITVTK
jgi:gliding motility-associated-like protein